MPPVHFCLCIYKTLRDTAMRFGDIVQNSERYLSPYKVLSHYLPETSTRWRGNRKYIFRKSAKGRMPDFKYPAYRHFHRLLSYFKCCPFLLSVWTLKSVHWIFKINFLQSYAVKSIQFILATVILDFWRMSTVDVKRYRSGINEKLDPEMWDSRWNFVVICSSTRDLSGVKYPQLPANVAKTLPGQGLSKPWK